ncbi:hypothetical protein CFC21_068691 [Triticum aestivum]|uniref:phosphatidylglycerophosphatase n=2 Tax=Triticum aestivum TaxID=4565 RepID=A0A9R1KPX9_WHEAT|nr:phosphatidylglycerophosphate phosphatase PTPMT2-like [Triticum aestivum]KAF7062045.1 hypothetical protein CFC21_068688 [Triticum aestivum]KAF7062048.1 hypothetical protein CFC21_068691 [Triticum aestivum]
MRSDEHTFGTDGVELQFFHGHDVDEDEDGSTMFADEEASAESSSATALDAAKRAAVGVGARVLFYPKMAYKLVAGRPARGKASEEPSSSSATTLDAAKHAAVGMGARALFYPTLAYSLARYRLSSEFHWWNLIEGTHIYLGAVPFPSDVPRLHDLGVRDVVTLTEPYERLVPKSLYIKHKMENLVLPTTDYLYAPSKDDLCRAAAFIHSSGERGRKTYVHCKAGRARSATVVMCYLVRYKGMTAKEAYDHVRWCRPRVSLAPAQWQAVQDFEDFYRRPAGGSE